MQITVTPTQLAAAFTEWERRYREEPAKFMSEAEKLLKDTPKSYGEACAPYFIEIMRDQGTVPAIATPTNATQAPEGWFTRLVCRVDDFIRPKGGLVSGGRLDVPPAAPADRPGEVLVKPKRTRKPRVVPNTTKDDEL